MGFLHNMDKEKAPSRKVLLPEGWRMIRIIGVKEGTSKAGNPQFIFRIQDSDTKHEEDLYAVATEGKRYFLKQILVACGVKELLGTFNWDVPDVLNKEILALVEHKPNEYINRQGETVKTTQHKIVDVKAIAWNE